MLILRKMISFQPYIQQFTCTNEKVEYGYQEVLLPNVKHFCSLPEGGVDGERIQGELDSKTILTPGN